MADFNPISKTITINFTCPYCGEEVVSEALYVPTPNFEVENDSDSMNYEIYKVVCGKCGHGFQTTIYNSMYGGEVNVEGVLDVEIYEDYDEEDYENYFFDITPEKITSVIKEIDSLSSTTKSFLYRQLYAGTITSMEAFLCSTLKKEILSSDAKRRKFVETYRPFREKKIPYSFIYREICDIDKTIVESLNGLIYHRLDIIKPIYKDTLNIDLGDVRDLMKAIGIRHDIVHRSGKDKNGKLHDISKEDVIDIVDKVSSLMLHINSNLGHYDSND